MARIEVYDLNPEEIEELPGQMHMEDIFLMKEIDEVKEITEACSNE